MPLRPQPAAARNGSSADAKRLVARRWRGKIRAGPEFVREGDDGGEFFEGIWLLEERVGAKLVGAFDVGFGGGGAEDHCREEGALGSAVKPFQKIEAAASGHLQIGDKKLRHWVALAVAVLAFAAQVSDRFCSVRANVNWLFEAGALESLLQEKNVVWIVFSDKDDDTLARHGADGTALLRRVNAHTLSSSTAFV